MRRLQSFWAPEVAPFRPLDGPLSMELEVPFFRLKLGRKILHQPIPLHISKKFTMIFLYKSSIPMTYKGPNLGLKIRTMNTILGAS